MKLDYNQVAAEYKNYRIPDPRIQALIDKPLRGTKRVINVGAGMGAYEPAHCEVVAIDPSEEMIARRLPNRGMAIKGSAENLPFADGEFDAAMAILTIHHWSDIAKGLREMRRVSRDKVLLLTWVYTGEPFWLDEYFPELSLLDRRIFPTLEDLRGMLGEIQVDLVPIPFDCSDGFACAYWRRPHRYLDPHARQAISSFHKIGNVDAGLARLKQDLNSGAWERRHGYLLEQNTLDCGYRLVVHGA